MEKGFNPYFIGLPILITMKLNGEGLIKSCFNPYFIGLPILIFYTHLLIGILS